MLAPVTHRRFEEPGPIAGQFLASRARIAGIMGPQGGGKTTTVVQKVQLKAAMQPASPIDGWARYRCVVWMRTYRELWAKVIPDWLDWVPQNDKRLRISWTGGRDNPAEHKWLFEVVAGDQRKKVMAEVWFRAIGDQTPSEAAKGIHATDGWLPEATSATAEMRRALYGRLGRYPTQEHGGAPERQLLCDWNAGDPYNWTSEFFITERPLELDPVDGRPMVEFFRQPGGREPGAENLHNLPKRYYEDQIAANADDPDWIKRMVDNQIGFMREGKAVFGEFDPLEHVSDAELIPWKGVPLIVAADAGLTPAALIGQRRPSGEWQTLEEVVTPRDQTWGAQRFAQELMLRLDAPRYRDAPKPETCYGDPSSGNPTEAASQSDQAELDSWLKIMARETGMPWKPSRCENNLGIRVNSVKLALERRVGGRIAFKVCRRHCPELIKGMGRDYKFERIATVTQAGLEYREKPTKNYASHVCNALEYLCANGGEQDVATGRAERRKRADERRKLLAAANRMGGSDPLAAYGGAV